MAASSSTRNEPPRWSQPGAISARKAAVPTPRGTAISMATAEVTTDPYTNDSPPNAARSPRLGAQSLLVTRAQPTFWTAGHAWTASKTTISPTATITSEAAAWQTCLNVQSAGEPMPKAERTAAHAPEEGAAGRGGSERPCGVVMAEPGGRGSAAGAYRPTACT